MRLVFRLVIGLLTACTTEPAITLEPGSGLDLNEVVKRLKTGLHTARDAPPAVIVEYVPGLETGGGFTLAASYPSAAAIAADLMDQHPAYTWEALRGDVIVARPVSGSYLTTPLPAGTYATEALCDLLKTWGGKAFPNNTLTHLATCMYRGAPKYRADMPAQVLSSRLLFGAGSDPVVRVRVAPGDRVIDAVVNAFDAFGFRFSAAVAPIMQSESIPPTWILSF